jgi:hypothetical protein
MTVVLPSLARMDSFVKRKKLLTKTATIISAVVPTLSSKSGRKRRSDNLDREEATAVTAIERPLLKRKRSSIALKNSATETNLEKMRKDLIPRIFEMNVDERKKCVKERKKFWKREFALQEEQFDELWLAVKETARDGI